MIFVRRRQCGIYSASVSIVLASKNKTWWTIASARVYAKWDGKRLSVPIKMGKAQCVHDVLFETLEQGYSVLVPESYRHGNCI
jgi:hypothetical protein